MASGVKSTKSAKPAKLALVSSNRRISVITSSFTAHTRLSSAISSNY